MLLKSGRCVMMMDLLMSSVQTDWMRLEDRKCILSLTEVEMMEMETFRLGLYFALDDFKKLNINYYL